MPLIYANQLARALKPVQPCYCLTGADPFLVQESAALIRQSLIQQGFEQRQVFTLESPSSFDWEGFHQTLYAPSLFAEKTIVEWVWPASKLTEKMFQPCLPFKPNHQVCVIIRAGYLSKTQLNAKWFKAFMGDSVIVQHWTASGQDLVTWTQQRAKHHKLSLTPQAAQLLANHYEGRLYGIEQLLMKVALFPHTGHVDTDTIMHHMDEQSSFDVFALQHAILSQSPEKVLSVLNHLKHMKVEMTLVLWCLHRLLHTALQSHTQSKHHDSQWLKGQGIWPKEQALFNQWFATLTETSVRHMLQSLADIDHQHKTGQVAQAWQHVCQLCLISISALPHVCE